MSRHLLVRADADSRIGLGHVLRTMAVADELARTGTAITYLCRTITPWAADQLRARGFDLRVLDLPETADQVDDATASMRILTQTGADAVLLDHYGLTTAWCAHVKPCVGLVAAFDDLACDMRNVDVLIDTSPARRAAEYDGLIPPGALCLAGPAYAALRPEFALARRTPDTDSTGPCRVAISMGGVDPVGVSLTCLEALDGRTDIDLTVILSRGAPLLAQTQERVARMTTPTRLLLDRTDMAAVLQDMDLVVGAGGTSALERCALGLPSVLAVLADNQIFNATHLAEAGAAVVLPDLSAGAVRAAVHSLLADVERRTQMGDDAGRLCDGMGAARVARAILERHSGVRLRPATIDDMQIVHDWQSEPGARRFARTPQVPTRDAHAAWFGARLARCDRDPFHIMLADGTAAGFVRLDQSGAPDTWEVSILVPEAARGRAIARTALGLLRLTHPRPHIVAEVHPENTASQRLFDSAGYSRRAPDRFASASWSEIVEKQRDGN